MRPSTVQHINQTAYYASPTSGPHYNPSVHYGSPSNIVGPPSGFRVQPPGPSITELKELQEEGITSAEAEIVSDTSGRFTRNRHPHLVMFNYEVTKFLHDDLNVTESSTVTPLIPDEIKVDKVILSWIFTTLSDPLQKRLIPFSSFSQALDSSSPMDRMTKSGNPRHSSSTPQVKPWKLVFTLLKAPSGSTAIPVGVMGPTAALEQVTTLPNAFTVGTLLNPATSTWNMDTCPKYNNTCLSINNRLTQRGFIGGFGAHESAKLVFSGYNPSLNVVLGGSTTQTGNFLKAIKFISGITELKELSEEGITSA
nr:hypothetical protein [Tanacetum cinerariifolium]